MAGNRQVYDTFIQYKECQQKALTAKLILTAQTKQTDRAATNM